MPRCRHTLLSLCMCGSRDTCQAIGPTASTIILLCVSCALSVWLSHQDGRGVDMLFSHVVSMPRMERSNVCFAVFKRRYRRWWSSARREIRGRSTRKQTRSVLDFQSAQFRIRRKKKKEFECVASLIIAKVDKHRGRVKSSNKHANKVCFRFELPRSGPEGTANKLERSKNVDETIFSPMCVNETTIRHAWPVSFRLCWIMFVAFDAQVLSQFTAREF